MKVPPAEIPHPDAMSANAGRFSLSLKGMRKALRQSGSRAEVLVRNIEQELVEWLWEGGTLLDPDSAPLSGDMDMQDLVCRATPIGDLNTILEVKRTPLQLIWYIADDAFARYVLHCCARYHEVVSYSKDVAGYRLTYLLRPNVTRPDHRAPAALDTPPVTDVDYSSHPESETDFLSDISEREADVEMFKNSDTSLGAITEAKPAQYPSPDSADSAEAGRRNISSVQGDNLSDTADIDDSASELGYVAVKLSSLSVGSRDSEEFVTVDVEQRSMNGLGSASQSTPQYFPARYGHSVSARRRTWDRSVSSPSRSPSKTMSPRRAAARRHYEAPRATVATLGATRPQTLYDYLYS
ncbi:hypothetical protein AX15_003201 [Amanita polypyramis BW_CC]|nr:hypothetical protein AX15_003201 [Amanita polypyramis BW_CC]